LLRCTYCGAVAVREAIGSTCPICGREADTFDLYEPLGFRTDFWPVDFDDNFERGPASNRPQLGLNAPSRSTYRIGGLEVSTFEAADVFTINDNGGSLFPLTRRGRSVFVEDPALYADPPHNMDLTGGPNDIR